MDTGIFITVEVDGKWWSLDIGDHRVTDEQVLMWLRSRGGHNPWAENVVLKFLGREQIAKEV